MPMESDKAILRSLAPGDPIKLKRDVFPHVKVREWTLQRKEDHQLLLHYPKKNYTLLVEETDIDWAEYRKWKKNRDSWPHLT